MANNRIKGITIKIGGDTTELTKALKDVNHIIATSNSELKDLNKALKLDPKNTELLAQKQEVLYKNIQASTERLEKLKEAQRQLGDYNKLTEEQKASYRALSVEIAKSEDALKKMNNELKGTSKIDLSKLKDSLKKVGEIAVEVSKKLLQVTTAIGGALASVIGLGVKSYASLEQNLGAIDKLFGDSADELVENSKKAYKEAGLSANQYMETATSFSASLLKSLNGDTKQAVALTDRAIKDMSDNANTFGTSMEEVMNVYKALSKEQFSTLDNLRLGYAGTKKGMQELIRDASRMKDIQKELNITVKDGDMSFANMINAISVMQRHLKIAGTTMKEAEGTITGSLNMMKASFDNFINGSGSPEALGDSIITFINNVANAIGKLAPSILKGIVDLIGKIVPEVGKILFTNIPILLDSISNMIDNLLSLLTNNTESIQSAVTLLIEKIVGFITTNLPKILQIAITLIVTLAQGITNAIPTIIPAIRECLFTIINTILDNLDLVIDTAIELIEVLTDALLSDESMDAIIDAVPKIIEKMVQVLANNMSKISVMGLHLMMALIEGILRIIPKLPEYGSNIIKAIGDGIYYAIPDVLNRANDVITEITNKFKKLPEEAVKWGKDLVDGLSKGLKQNLNKVKDAASGVGNAIKSFLHFSRPDEGALRDYETWMPDFMKGLAEGIRNSKYLVENATLELANDMSSSLLTSTGNALRGLKGGVETSLNPTINPNAYNLNYQLLTQALIKGLKETPVVLDDREVGRFVDKQVSEEVFS